MAAPPGKPNLSKEQHRVLALLDHIPHGITENTLVLAHGFDSTMIASLIDAGLATGRRESVTGAMPAPCLSGGARSRATLRSGASQPS